MMATTTIYYVSDIHGSERCFRKFLNAAKFYKANVLVMGGDILGKAIVFLEEIQPGVYLTEEHGHQVKFTTETEVQGFEKRASDRGLYPYRCRQGEPQELRASGEIGPLFEDLMKKRLAEWLALAEERLAGTGVRCFIMGGNDDPPSVLTVLEGRDTRIVSNPEDHIVSLDDDSEMLSGGWSNPTPWHTPRECSEEELGKRIDTLMVQVRRPESLVMNLHVPPSRAVWTTHQNWMHR